MIDEDMEDDEDNEEDMDGKNNCFFPNLYFYSAVFLDDPLYDNSDGDGEAEHNVSMFEIANGNYDGGNSREGEGELTFQRMLVVLKNSLIFYFFSQYPIHIGSNFA